MVFFFQSLSSNDWMNSIACGDETGRVIVSLPMQIAHIDEKKVKKNSKVNDSHCYFTCVTFH